MTRSSQLLALPLVLTLAACGGGGSGSIASAPPPVSTSPPSSSLAPTLAPSGVPRAPVSSPVTPTESFTSLAASVGQSVGALAGPDQTTIGRDASGGYTITLLLNSQTANGGYQLVDRKVEFSANTLESQTGERKVFVALQSPASPARINDSILYIYDGANFNNAGLQYVDFGELLTCNTASGMGCTDFTWPGRAFFVFGDATPVGEIPLLGTAGYSGHLNGYSGLGGDVALSVNFASQAISGGFSRMAYLVGDQAGGFESFAIPDLGLSGRINAGGALSGTLTSGGDLAAPAGQWNARFFGPGAVEIGGAFLIADIGGAPAPGVFGLRKN